MCNSTVCAAIMSVVSALLVVLLLMQHKSASLDFYSSSSQLVTLRTTSTLVGLRKKYLHVSPSNGLVRTDGNSSGALSARWLMVSLSAPTVARLRASTALAAENAVQWGEKKDRRTRSGCECSGFYNEHGFGAYCSAWEEAHQEEWCYVDDKCGGGKKGSFGRRFEVCTPRYDSYDESMWNASAAPYADDWAPTVWVPPPPCGCSGYSNKHGYGAHCKAWEEAIAPGQLPWCYVHPNCTADGVSKRGSFGEPFVDCVASEGVAPAAHPPPPASPPPPPPSPPPPPRTSLTMRERRQRRMRDRSHAHYAQEAALMKLVAAAGAKSGRAPFVAFLSEATHGFLTVEPPPSSLELFLHAKSPALSLNSVFSRLPTGELVALGTNALVAPCTRPGAAAPLACTGYFASPRDGHRRLLRTLSVAAPEKGERRSPALKFALEPVNK